MEPVKAVLFDLDGTLLDTAPEFTFCMNELLNQESREHVSIDAFRPYVTHGSGSMVRFAFGLGATDPQLEDLRRRFLDLYTLHLGSKTNLVAGVDLLIAHLEQNDLPWGIVTNKPKQFALPLIDGFAFLKKSQTIVTGDMVSASKPSPIPLLEACKRMNIIPNHTWYLGDADIDVIASHAAGMRCAVAKYGYIAPEENPLDWNADFYIDHPQHLISVLTKG